jgi:hypothetical protein
MDNGLPPSLHTFFFHGTSFDMSKAQWQSIITRKLETILDSPASTTLNGSKLRCIRLRTTHAAFDVQSFLGQQHKSANELLDIVRQMDQLQIHASMSTKEIATEEPPQGLEEAWTSLCSRCDTYDQ